MATALLLTGLFTSGCGGGSTAPVSSGAQVGSTVNQPDPSIGSVRFIVDANHGGAANSMKIVGLAWGRLVNVHDAGGALQQTDMVVGEDIKSDNVDYRLDVNPVTEENSVTILHAAGTPAYELAFQRLEQGLIPIQDKSLLITELPPFTLVPRNAAIVIKFDDLLDVSTITKDTIKVLTGNPINSPYLARIIQDINHGDLADHDGNGVLEFHSTRVIIDTTISTLEGATINLPVNEIGLPGSVTQNLANVGVRIPTQADLAAGQTAILRNLTQHGVSVGGNGNSDLSVPTHDIVRGMRSGGATSVTNDVNNGFLLDQIPPRVVGTQAVGVTTPTGVLGDYVTNVTYATLGCAAALKAGDVIQQPGIFAEVTQTSLNPTGALVQDVHYRIVFPLNGQLSAGPAQVSTIWDGAQGHQGCFVRFSSLTTPPTAGVSTDSSVILTFSEPMDPTTVGAFDQFTITRVVANPTAFDYQVGSSTAGSDLKTFRFTLPDTFKFRHTQGSAENYYINVASGATGPTDLAGNPLELPLPQVKFSLDPQDSTELNGGFALRFGSSDELFGVVNLGNGISFDYGVGLPELRGQFLLDFNNSILKPRPVTRYAAIADRSQLIPSIMPAFTAGVQTPLSGLGSKLQTLWRYCDVGFGLSDESNFNIDVEHMFWAPVGGSVVADTYTHFMMKLCHSNKLPDETINIQTLFPIYPGSGLVTVYASNVLDATNDAPKIVYPKEKSYSVIPSDVHISTTGTRIMPFPMNRNLGVNETPLYYTWRDTSVLAKGGLGGPGAELNVVCRILLGNPMGCIGSPYAPGLVPSIGLPLLMEFRCYPDSGALGLNAFDINLAINSSSVPNFRAFSTGGVSSSGATVSKNPDLEDVATGGFNPTSVPPGAATLKVDNSWYLGELELVLRVSRVHTIWFDTTSPTAVYAVPVVEPKGTQQPFGTSVELAFRGATVIGPPPTAAIKKDASFINPYGDPTAGSGSTITYFNNDATWKASLSSLNGARFFQARITFFSNVDTNLSPTLSALAFAYKF